MYCNTLRRVAHAEGLIPSVGAVGDALDNTLCEKTIGLHKTECIREGSPFRPAPIDTLADLEDMAPRVAAARQLPAVDTDWSLSPIAPG